MSSESVYKVIFYNQGEIYELYARDIYQSEMYGFIEVEEFLFADGDKVIVNPGEEKLKIEFADVKRSYLPMQAIIRIDEVEREGEGKIKEIKASDNIAHFPGSQRLMPGQTPPSSDKS